MPSPDKRQELVTFDEEKMTATKFVDERRLAAWAPDNTSSGSDLVYRAARK